MDNLDKEKIKIENNFNDEEKVYELYNLFKSLQFKESEKKDEFINKVNLSFSAFERPIQYKNLLLYPITMQYIEFVSFLFESLILRKNTSGDIKAISMSYFDYLFYLAEEKENPQYVEMLYQLLLIVFKKEKYAKNNGEIIINGYDNLPLETIKFFSKDGKHYKIGILKDEIKLDNFKKENGNYYNFDDYDIFDSSDFDKIREIICMQNNIEIPDERLRKDVLDELEKAEEVYYENNKDKYASLEERINSLIVVGGIKREEIMNMSIRNFENCVERMSIYINYIITMILSPEMEKKDRDKALKECSSWLMRIKKQSRYERYTTSFSNFNNKLKPNM